jgi:hypothetical protein
MSEHIGDPDRGEAAGTAADTSPIGTATGTAAARTTTTRTTPAPETVHEAYAFACLNCGYGWEQAYEIEHRTDAEGHQVIRYRANGVPVPSPLSSPGCPGCGGSHVRILRAGRVAEAHAFWHAPRPAARARAAVPESTVSTARPRREHRLHLPFHFLLRRRHSTPER